MKRRLVFSISKGLVFVIVLTICINCNEEPKSPFVSALYKNPAYKCSFEADGENRIIQIADHAGYGITYDNQKDSLEITYDIMFEEDYLSNLSFILRKYYHSAEIVGFTKDTPGGWDVKELSQTEILMAFKEGYYKNMYNHNHGSARDRITMYYNRLVRVNNIEGFFSNYFMFDMSFRYDEPPENCGYFHIYDVQALDNCIFTFKADFDGLGYADMQINGHLNAVYFNRKSEYCMRLRNNPLILY